MSIWLLIAVASLITIFVLGAFMGVPPMSWGEHLGLLLFFVFMVGLYMLGLKPTGNL